ncbi:methionine synthase [Treponema primitia ZAS-2]|uniref:Methionine synthase n=1 Tax=Treponema primitia (strain ATCC BAA-887 / DSM 12427 / ZAS-2) TaxID=545694 RepID=F5YP94_TREPZ|nr:cobalamin-dependent protein [Treponema primitia]AEF84032.1 methionine synthase [Treponema primitia ZAS-2]
MGVIKDSLSNLDDEKALAEVKKALDANTAPDKILGECQDAMVAIGNAFSAGTMFVSDLMMAGAIFEDISKLVLPKIKAAGTGKSGAKVVIGTVKNDIHNIGKDIVANMLTASGFDVIDVGVDVPAENFVKAVKDSGAKALAMSCLLVSCYDSIKDTVEALKKEGLRDKVKIIIGGGPVDDHVVKYSGADGFGLDPQACIHLCEEAYA